MIRTRLTTVGRSNGNAGTLKLSEHLASFSAVAIPPKTAADLLAKNLRAYGPVVEVGLGLVEQSKAFLMPVKSFTTRFVISDYHGWSLLLSDMRFNNCVAIAQWMSSMSGCQAISIVCRRDHREFAVLRGGTHVRQVESLCDVDRWHFRQEGGIQPFEDESEYAARRKSDRLSLEALRRYFRRLTGLTDPQPRDCLRGPYGIERSISKLVVQVRTFRTVDDVH